MHSPVSLPVDGERMRRRLPPLGALRAFEAAARRQSFKDAAAELGVTPTAISHQIRHLEARLGLALFERHTRKVVLTAEGNALYPTVRQSFDAIAEALVALKRLPTRKVATLSATVAFTAKLLVPRVATIRKHHPDWDLRLHASDDAVDLHAGEADAAIRYGRGKYTGLTSLPLFADVFAPVCSPHLALRTPAGLRRATLIHFEWGPAASKETVPTWQSWAKEAQLDGLDTGAGITFNDESSAIQAAIAGQGVALLSLALVAAELRSGALVQPFGPTLPGWRYDLVYPTGSEDRPAVAMLKAWVMAELSNETTTREAGRGMTHPSKPRRFRLPGRKSR